MQISFESSQVNPIIMRKSTQIKTFPLLAGVFLVDFMQRNSQLSSSAHVAIYDFAGMLSFYRSVKTPFNRFDLLHICCKYTD